MEYLFSELAAQANGARTLVRGNVSTVQTRPQNSNASFARQRPCGLKSALRRSVGRATTTLNTYWTEVRGYHHGLAPRGVASTRWRRGSVCLWVQLHCSVSQSCTLRRVSQADGVSPIAPSRRPALRGQCKSKIENRKCHSSSPPQNARLRAHDTILRCRINAAFRSQVERRIYAAERGARMKSVLRPPAGCRRHSACCGKEGRL